MRGRCLVAWSALAAAILLLSACNGSDATDSVDRVRESARGVWTLASNVFNGAANDYIDYYYDEYQRPLPDDIETDAERLSYIVGVQEELVDRLAIVVELHGQLGPALESAIAQDAIPAEEVADSRRYVDLTGRWLVIQEEVAEGSLDCLELAYERVQACLVPLAVANQQESDRLALLIEQVAGRLFGA
jgi:hypothetical protein